MNIDEYITQHSDAEPAYLSKINRKTHLKIINPRMLSGHLQGRVLAMLCQMIQPERVLELGTFTGYSALCMAEALPDNGVCIQLNATTNSKILSSKTLQVPYMEKKYVCT